MKINVVLKKLRLIVYRIVLLGTLATSAMAQQPINDIPRISGADAVSIQQAFQANPVAGQGALSVIQKNPALMNSLVTAFKENPKAVESLNNNLRNNPQLSQQLSGSMANFSYGASSNGKANFSSKGKEGNLSPSYGQPISGYGVQSVGQPSNTKEAPLSSEASTVFSGTGWDKTPEEQSAYKSAFREVTEQAFPLKPDEIVTLHRLLDATEAAVSTHPKPPPKPVSASVVVNTAPGSTPPIIRLSKGYVTSLVFLDSSGAPWPIAVYDLGDPNAFNIAWDRKGNTLMVQAMQEYAYGNIAVNLRGMNTPVTLTLVTGQPVVDYRVDLRIMGRGPLAKPDLNSLEMPDQADTVLLSVLDGIAPEGSTLLKTHSSGVQAWICKDVMYVRTQYNLLSPAWLAKMSSADGTHAYKLQKASALLIAGHGSVSTIKIEGL